MNNNTVSIISYETSSQIDHKSLWRLIQKKVRVIVLEETTTQRSHACDGLGWEEKTEVANWMWVTNLFEDFSGNLKNTVKVCHSRWQIENKCFRRNSKYLESRSYLPAQI